MLHAEASPKRVALRILAREKAAGYVYPWELREEIQNFQNFSNPRDVKDGERGSDSVFTGYLPGSIPGGRGKFTVLSPEAFDRAEKYGWVTEVKRVVYQSVSTGAHSTLNFDSYDHVLCNLTDEGRRVVSTPLKDLILKRPPLPGKLEDVAQVYEALRNAGAPTDGHLEKVIYKGRDPWSARNIPWYKSLTSKYPDIVTPKVYEEFFRRPLRLTEWRKELWDLLSDISGSDVPPWSAEYDEFSAEKGPSKGYVAWIVYSAFHKDLEPAKMERVLGAPMYRITKRKPTFPIPQSRIKELQTLILRQFPDNLVDNLVKRLKDVVKGKPTPEKTVVNSEVREKIQILDRLLAGGVPQAATIAQKVREIYLSGERPSDDDLKALRNMLYRSQMRSEADNFRV